jgi:hypothetical protein
VLPGWSVARFGRGGRRWRRVMQELWRGVEDCKERRKTGSAKEDLTAGCHHSSAGHCHPFTAAA